MSSHATISLVRSNSNTYGGPTYEIDRTMPTIMTGRMSETQWNDFCDEVDINLKPLNRLKVMKVVNFYLFILLIILLLVALYSYVLILVEYRHTYIIVGVTFIILFSAIECWKRKTKSRVCSEIIKLCQSISRTQNQLVFHFRDEIYRSSRQEENDIYYDYIEVFVVNDVERNLNLNINSQDATAVLETAPIEMTAATSVVVTAPINGATPIDPTASFAATVPIAEAYVVNSSTRSYDKATRKSDTKSSGG